MVFGFMRGQGGGNVPVVLLVGRAQYVGLDDEQHKARR